MSLDLSSIQAAHARIRPHIIRTPVLTNARLNAACGGQLFFKCENLQKAGAFKARGATNAVFSLADVEALRGVATHSSGNHAAALARAAKLRGIPAHIVMPSNSARPKIRMVEAYGGKITFCEPTQAAREAACARIIEETLATLVHPFEDERVMAGQGTAALELLEQVPDLDYVLCPVGGGGLLGGTAVAAKALAPSIRVIGTEPAGADDAARSFRAGQRLPLTSVNTIADGLRTTIGEPNLALALRLVDDVVTVSEAAIVAAMHMIWDAVKIVIEPSAAVPYAAIMERRLDVSRRRVGIILSGGNVDLDHLPWIAKKGTP
ncbi:MAG: pyridoxal-phosphate dependent enzyme [Verrucomicrobia bacterium]|jgi:threonine dehydratase|nr:pyridoxal-phosphate dependent enzyme [Verrucomicrobiota bacterium]